MDIDLCVFCFQPSNNPADYCKDNPGEGCTYGHHHEFRNGPYAKPKPKQQVKKVDKQLCLKCKLHSKNPASATSECVHEYASEN